ERVDGGELPRHWVVVAVEVVLVAGFGVGVVAGVAEVDVDRAVPAGEAPVGVVADGLDGGAGAVGDGAGRAELVVVVVQGARGGGVVPDGPLSCSYTRPSGP